MKISETGLANLKEIRDMEDKFTAEAYIEVYNLEGVEIWSGKVLACTVRGMGGQYLNFMDVHGSMVTCEGPGIHWVLTSNLAELVENWEAIGATPREEEESRIIQAAPPLLVQ